MAPLVFPFPFTLRPATFLSRPNRFLCRVLREGEEVLVHLPSTGRLAELLRPGATVWVDWARAGPRTTGRLVAVGEEELVAVWAGLAEILFAYRRGIPRAGPPPALPGGGRADFLWDGTAVEVKGVTLYVEEGAGGRGCEGRIALFPDAPTERGRRQVEALRRVRNQGMSALLAFELLGGEAEVLRLNETHDPAFAGAVRRALQAGVAVLAEAWRIEVDRALFLGEVPLSLS